MGIANSYAERLFDFPFIGPLSKADADDALQKPAKALNVTYDADALNLAFFHTRGYPYFIQEWGKHTWDVAESSPVRKSDVEKASIIAIADLDESFFRVRFDWLTLQKKIIYERCQN